MVNNIGWNMDNVGYSYVFDSSSVNSLVAAKEKRTKSTTRKVIEGLTTRRHADADALVRPATVGQKNTERQIEKLWIIKHTSLPWHFWLHSFCI